MGERLKFEDVVSTLKDKSKRTVIITFLTMLYNFFWSIAKILLGALSGGYFFCASGVVTLLIGSIKYIFYRNHDHDSMNVKTQKSIKICILLIAIGLLYAGYMSTLFVYPQLEQYDVIVAIAIATFSFIELAISIRNALIDRKKGDTLLSALRNCNLASAIFAIVLTQVALMTSQGEDASIGSAISGIIAGVIVVIIAVIYLIKLKRRQKDMIA